MGGLARRASYVEAFKNEFRNSIPSLHVDVGHLLSNELNPGDNTKLREDVEVMNRWMLKGFSQFRLDAANVSYHDLFYCSHKFGADKIAEVKKETPFVEDMISSNVGVGSGDDKPALFKPYTIKEISGNRFADGKTVLKVGFIGLTQPPPGNDNKTKYLIEDPLQKVKAVLPEVRSKVDLVVVLAYLPNEIAKQMARENPGIDVIIGANEMHLPVPAMREGNTVICYAWHQTKSIGELRLYIDSQGKVKDYLNRYVSLDKAVPDQAEALKIVESSKKEIQEAQKRIADKFDVAGKTVPTILSTGQPKTPTN